MLLEHCKDAWLDGEKKDIPHCKNRIINWLTEAQSKAMRTLGFAYKIVEGGETDCQQIIQEGGLTFLGTAAIMDPIRTDIAEAVNECRSAGIAIKIITGDTQVTAIEIAKKIGLWSEDDTERNRISGPAFAELSDLVPEDDSLSSLWQILVDRIEADMVVLNKEVHALWKFVPEDDGGVSAED